MTESESVTTLSRLFLYICRTYPKPELLKAKADGVWRALSTSEFEQKVRRLTLGLRALGLKPGDKAALLAESGPHWIVADFAILCAGGITVPIFPTLPAEHVRYILDDSEASFVLSAGGVLWEKIAAVRPQLRGLKKAVLLTGGSEENGLTIDDVLAMGAKAEADDPGAFERSALAIAADDLASIIYTSGTTGRPKGVMLTHGNFVSNILSLASVVPYDETDIHPFFSPPLACPGTDRIVLVPLNGGTIARFRRERRLRGRESPRDPADQDDQRSPSVREDLCPDHGPDPDRFGH